MRRHDDQCRLRLENSAHQQWRRCAEQTCQADWNVGRHARVKLLEVLLSVDAEVILIERDKKLGRDPGGAAVILCCYCLRNR